MKRRCRIVLAAILLVPTAACSQEKFENARERSEARIDLGSFENSTYSNQYLGFTITIPTDWHLQTRKAQQAWSDLAEEILVGDDENFAALLDADKHPPLHLFGAMKHPRSAPGLFNPSISSAALSVRHMPGIKAADYQSYIKKAFEPTAAVSFPRDIERTSLGGREFDMLYIETSILGMVIRQESYVTIIKGYLLSFIISYTSDEEAASLKSALGTVLFDI